MWKHKPDIDRHLKRNTSNTVYYLYVELCIYIYVYVYEFPEVQYMASTFIRFLERGHHNLQPPRKNM